MFLFPSATSTTTTNNRSSSSSSLLLIQKLPKPTVVALAVLVPLTAFGTVEAILHLKKYFGRTLRKVISIVDAIVPTREQIKQILIDNPPIPIEEIEQHIQEETDSVVEGAERKIHWDDPIHKTKTPISVVFFHGWSACAQEGRPVVGRIAQHLQANLYCCRLPGHGRQRISTKPPGWVDKTISRGPPCGTALLKEAKPQELFLSALDSLRVGLTLGDRVLLVGISTGGALATWLATLLLEENPNSAMDDEGNVKPGTIEALGDRLAGLVLISPAYALSHPLYPVLKHSFAALRVLPGFLSHSARTRLIAAAIGPHRIIPPSNEDHHRFSTLRYPSAAILHLLDVLYELEIINHGAITVPTLMIGNPQDPVVNFRVKATNAFLKFGDAPNKVLYCLTRGENQHIVSCDYQSPSTVDEVTEVIRMFLNVNGIAPPPPRQERDHPATDSLLGGGKRYMMELELERTTEDIIHPDEKPSSMTRRPSSSRGLGTFASYPSLGELTRPLEF